jgi:hypothetical protein
MQNLNKGLRHKTAAASENREDTRLVRQEGYLTGVCEASSCVKK